MTQVPAAGRDLHRGPAIEAAQFPGHVHVHTYVLVSDAAGAWGGQEKKQTARAARVLPNLNVYQHHPLAAHQLCAPHVRRGAPCSLAGGTIGL